MRGNSDHKNSEYGNFLRSAEVILVFTMQVFNEIKGDLYNFGDAVSKDIYYHHANVCLNEPVLEQYDAWGNRVDNIIMLPSWRALRDVSAKEGLIAIPYENKYAQWR